MAEKEPEWEYYDDTTTLSDLWQSLKDESLENDPLEFWLKTPLGESFNPLDFSRTFQKLLSNFNPYLEMSKNGCQSILRDKPRNIKTCHFDMSSEIGLFLISRNFLQKISKTPYMIIGD